jgi:phenylalanine-4-hydroxylase
MQYIRSKVRKRINIPFNIIYIMRTFVFRIVRHDRTLFSIRTAAFKLRCSVGSCCRDILKDGISALGICVLTIPRLQRLRRLN